MTMLNLYLSLSLYSSTISDAVTLFHGMALSALLTEWVVFEITLSFKDLLLAGNCYQLTAFKGFTSVSLRQLHTSLVRGFDIWL